MELCAENLNLEREHDFAIENEREYDEFISDLGSIRMKARQMLQEVKYEKVKE